MHDSTAEILKILGKHALLWPELAKSNVVVTATRSGAGALHRRQDWPAQAQVLLQSCKSSRTVEALADALAGQQPTAPCVIDLAHACTMVEQLGLGPGQALVAGRVRYQGTDGVRGKVAACPSGEHPLAALVQRGEFTPALCGLLCRAWMKGPLAGTTPTVVVGEDGRDALGPRNFFHAAAEALASCGAKVLDLGVAPTPLVAAAAAYVQAPLAVVITASHNPSDQNGIKFFLHGKKPLPEPLDYMISALAFREGLALTPASAVSGAWQTLPPDPILHAYLRSALTTAELKVLGGARFIIDTAHGAFSPYARSAMADLGLDAQVINDDMTGDNVNRDSGVAHMEGKEHVDGKDVLAEIAIVRQVYEASRTLLQTETRSRTVFGVAVDADGDRGFVLMYNRPTDRVEIIDGDRCAYLIAKACAARGERGVFAGTVESDLAVMDAAAALGLPTAIKPVGDKWLTSSSDLEGKILIVEESSGHVAWPVRIKDNAGNEQTVLAGNGLLTALRTAAAIIDLGLTAAQAAEPFSPGVIKSFYTYFVDRSRLYRGSEVWQADVAAARDALQSLKAGGQIPAGSLLREMPFADDPDMLYLQLEARDRRLGTVFARNSGTENKTATYARGLREYRHALLAVAAAINANHVAMMKDRRLAEARAGEAIMAQLATEGKLTLQQAHMLAGRNGVTSQNAVLALLYALVKEGRARRSGECLLPA